MQDFHFSHRTMTRIKGGLLHRKRRTGILKHTKGYRWGRKSKIKVAKVAMKKAGQHAFADRRKKKRNMRQLWTVRLNAAVRKHGLSYSIFIGMLKKEDVFEFLLLYNSLWTSSSYSSTRFFRRSLNLFHLGLLPSSMCEDSQNKQ